MRSGVSLGREGRGQFESCLSKWIFCFFIDKSQRGIVLPFTIFAGSSVKYVCLSNSFLKEVLNSTAFSLTLSTLIKISAQCYLDKFYTSLGFNAIGEGYLEDGIPHIEMIKNN